MRPARNADGVGPPVEPAEVAAPDHAGASGVGARDAHRGLHPLGAALEESNTLGARNHVAETLGHLHLEHVREARYRAARRDVRHRIDDELVRVAEGDRAEGHRAVHQLTAIGGDDPAAARAHEVGGRMRVIAAEQRGGPLASGGGAAGNDGRRALSPERGGVGFVDRRHGLHEMEARRGRQGRPRTRSIVRTTSIAMARTSSISRASGLAR